MKFLLVLFALSSLALATPQVAMEQAPPGVRDAEAYAAVARKDARNWESGFCLMGESDKPARQATRFRLAIGEAHLFFVAEAREASAELKFQTGNAKREIWKEDSIELFLQPGSDPSVAFQLLVNAKGDFDGYRLLQFGIMTEPWRPKLSMATWRGEHYWGVVLAIPLAELGPDPQRREWRVQVARNRPGRDQSPGELTVWAPTSAGLREFSSFGTAVLPKEVDLRPFAWLLESIPGDQRVVRSKDQTGYQLERRLSITNETGAYRSVVMESTVDDAVVRKALAVPPGRARQVTLVYDLQENTSIKGYAVDRLLAGKEADQLLAFRSEEIAAGYEPWHLEVETPGYRSLIFESQNLEKVKAVFRVSDGESELTGLAAAWEGEDVSLPARMRPQADGGWSVEVDGIAALSPGIYQLVVTGNSAEGPFKVTQTIRKLERQDGEVWIDAKGIVHRDGLPFGAYGFVFGGGGRVRHHPGLQANAFAPVYADNKELMFKRISANAGHGIVSFVYVPTAGPQGTRKGQGNKPLSAEERESFEELATTLAGNPDVMGYYLWDEPELHDVHPVRLKEIYEILRENDPHKPVVILNNSVAGVRDYLPTCDISMPDPYVWFLRGGGSAQPMESIGMHLEPIPIGSPSFQARWVTPQAFDGEYFGRAGNRGPTAEEMRTQQVSALIEGVSGVLWFSSFLTMDEPGVRASITYLSKEFQWLFNWRQRSLPRKLSELTGGQAAWFDGEKTPVLLIVNTEWKLASLTVSDDAIAAHRSWVEIGTGEAYPADGRRLTLPLQPYQSRILVPAGTKRPDGLDWKAVLRYEQELWAATRPAPANMAHRDHGGMARLITPKGGIHRVMAMIDGIIVTPEEGGRGYHHYIFQPGTMVQIDFSQPIVPKRLVIHYANFLEGTLQLLMDGKWVEQGALHPKGDRLEVGIDSGGVKVEALRLVIAKVPSNRLIIHEIEVLQ